MGKWRRGIWKVREMEGNRNTGKRDGRKRWREIGSSGLIHAKSVFGILHTHTDLNQATVILRHSCLKEQEYFIGLLVCTLKTSKAT